MSKGITAAAVASANVDIETIEDLLDDLDLATGETDVVTEIVPDDDLEELASDETLNAVAGDLEREEFYEAQPAEEPVAEAPETAPATAPTPKTGKVVKTAAAPRTPRDLNALASINFVLEGDTTHMSVAALDAAKTATLATRPGQKKVDEKFENLLTSVAAGKAPSAYTVIAFKLLDTKKTISTSDLVTAYRTPGAKTPTEGYNEGTARSQAGQMMSLFETMKIATRGKGSLTLNPNSTVAAKLRSVLATA